MTMMGEVLYEVFLDFRKAYYNLEWYIFLDVLVAYGVGPQTELLICRYWD